MKGANGQPTLTNFKIFLALIRRDMLVLSKNYRRMIIDSVSVVATQALVFGKLFPLMGMPPELAAPAYIGTATGFAIFLGFGHASNLTEDLERNRFFDYYLTLPISKHWVLARYIVSFAIENGIVVAPPLVIATGLLTGLRNANWPAFIVFYPFVLAFFGLLFLMFGMRYRPLWFRSNIWPRRLMPLIFFTCGISTWQAVHAFSPTIAYLMLLNPVTYAPEGMRSALLGGNAYLPVPVCIGALIMFSIPLVWLLNQSIQRRLDPV